MYALKDPVGRYNAVSARLPSGSLLMAFALVQQNKFLNNREVLIGGFLAFLDLSSRRTVVAATDEAGCTSSAEISSQCFHADVTERQDFGNGRS